jgi:hypothetical protein
VPPSIFISHSADDMEIIRFFREAFDDTKVRPVTMEYEKWSRGNQPNWEWIAREIRRSRALFVILTKSVVSKVQTQNWISFEIGVAAGTIPQRPVYVFKEEDIKFPVPYLNHYFPNRLSPALQLEGNMALDLKIIAAREMNKGVLRQIIKNPRQEYDDHMFRCQTCKTVFRYWSMEDKSFFCPCCSGPIFSGLNKYHKPKPKLDSDNHRPV